MKNSEIERYVARLFTGTLNEADDILLEKSKFNSIENSLNVFYIHMIKYYYQPLKRSNSWVASIINSRQDIVEMYVLNNHNGYKGFKAACAKFDEDKFRECYNDAKKVASLETGINIEYLDEYPFHNREYDFFNFNHICDANYLYYFLLSLALDNKDKDIVKTQFKEKGLI